VYVCSFDGCLFVIMGSLISLWCMYIRCQNQSSLDEAGVVNPSLSGNIFMAANASTISTSSTV
jgi:hypothetical protein